MTAPDPFVPFPVELEIDPTPNEYGSYALRFPNGDIIRLDASRFNNIPLPAPPPRTVTVTVTVEVPEDEARAIVGWAEPLGDNEQGLRTKGTLRLAAALRAELEGDKR